MMFLDMQYRLLDLMTSGQMTKEEVHRIGHQRMDILMRGILTESGLLRLREKVKYNIDDEKNCFFYLPTRYWCDGHAGRRSCDGSC